MKSKPTWLALILLVGIVFCLLSCGEKAEHQETAEETEAPVYTAADTLHWNLFVAYLQEHFDDFHDITMRYHHLDHTINGLVEIKMLWENDRLTTAEVIGNATGNDDLPEALMAAMHGWEIEGLEGPAELTLPVKVKLVGLDDPDFPNTAILTGEVSDTDGRHIHGAMVMIKPEVAGMVFRAETNREGIFVRTLIPPGTWNLECSHPGYETAVREGVTLAAGQHMRERIVLEKK